MAIYNFISACGIFILIRVIKSIPFFSSDREWTFLKEILSVILALLGMGIIIYFMGFLMEKPIDRWNLKTFLDSCFYAFLIGIIPFAFFTLVNYRHLVVKEITKEFDSEEESGHIPEDQEDKIRIGSQLKKEELSFFPHELMYAESNGNYVVFHLADARGEQRKIIRNSIGNIEQQLTVVPFFCRTHRAFIVNVKKIRSKKGNALGYRLRLSGTQSEIPVSRQKVQSFDLVLNRYK